MKNTIDMQHLRYLNLFYKITKVSTSLCFNYNNMIIFCVPKRFISQSIGKNLENLKKVSGIVKKRVRVVTKPNSIDDAKTFIKSIISPIEFNDLEIKGNEIILTAGSQNKAALIGRNKRRLLEMQKIINNFFGKEFKII